MLCFSEYYIKSWLGIKEKTNSSQDIFHFSLATLAVVFQAEWFGNLLDQTSVVFLQETVEDRLFLTIIAILNFEVWYPDGLAAGLLDWQAGLVQLRVVIVNSNVVVQQDTRFVYVGR
jgi:hypothetical protein